MSEYKDVPFSDLIGKTITSCEGFEKGSDEVIFITDEATYKMYHSQSCCESVTIEDITGDVDDVLNSPILLAEETSKGAFDYGSDTEKWTFYKLATQKGYVTIRWYGASNGYYGIDVYFERFGK